MKHINNGSCDKCEELFNAFPNFCQPLKDWFLKTQAKVKDCHISQAGRGKVDQEADFTAGKSKAHYGQSSHNYNAAVDIFQLTADGKAAWPELWFRDKVGTAVYSNNCDPEKKLTLNWYGAPHSPFRELPHIEWADWNSAAHHGDLPLVEPK